MVRVLIVALAGAGLWYGWRMFQRQQARVGEELRKAEAVLRKRDAVRLEKDPETGVYRPTERRDG